MLVKCECGYMFDTRDVICYCVYREDGSDGFVYICELCGRHNDEDELEIAL